MTETITASSPSGATSPRSARRARSEPKPARQRRSGTRLTIGVRLAQVALLLVLLGAWQLVASQGWIEPVLAKTPGEAWAYFTAAVQSGEISSNLRATMTAVVIAWILASAVGVAVGLSLGLLPTLERIMSPFLDAANAMPRLALAPLLIVIFGITMTAKVALAFTLVFFIVCSSARAGVKSVDDEWLRLSTVLNASKTQVFWHILLPVATPGIFCRSSVGADLFVTWRCRFGTDLVTGRAGPACVDLLGPVPDGSGLRDPHTSRNRRSRPQPGHELRRALPPSVAAAGSTMTGIIMDTNVITPAVQLDGLTISFPSPDGSTKTVVDNLDLTIPRGQFVSLVGRSGCGKTTLLNALAGLVDATEGKTEVLGTTPFDARSRMGFMMARDALFPWRTAQKNVEYGLELRGVPKAERRTQSERWLAAVQMSEASRLWTWQLSQGMRQRVALARTWALDPDILLMDEPFAALDAQTRVEVQREFLELWQSQVGRTVIFVTHDLGEAICLSDRVLLLGAGRVIDDVSIDIERPRELETLTAEPRYIEIFNRLRGQLDH
ncbi:ATP-binding cassette domain-containing protein [Rhodococcus sp. IEGM 1302]|uniref:ATP-binding cassette domain-containing protein n=2 Tax=Nocardiaceae TaxID=85025 RepID=UPI0024B7C278|nr:ATP-binding cassette domain-containing protein [Rhodococcus sp. IEGM 1302]MDI9941985.1 ATP-binding cassette domain-containing protein [Rhodococcus sp. IEGM 1302]